MESSHEEFRIKRLDNKDILIFQKLILLFQEVFDMENTATAKEAYLTGLLGKPGFIAYVAMRGNEVVGGLTAYELPMYHAQHAEIFIYDIAVKPEFQRRGVGKELLTTLHAYGRQKGIKDIFVDASEEDQHALDFYHATGGKAEKVVQFTYTVNH